MDAGCPRNVTELVELFYQSLYRYAYRLSGSAADADDLTQETFCKAQAQFKQLRDRSRAKPWLFSIVRNLYLHRLRSERQHSIVSLEQGFRRLLDEAGAVDAASGMSPP